MCRKILNLSKHLPNVSRIGYGCMGLGGEWNTDTIFDKDVSQAYSAIEAALENGINFFDHADIYRHGKSEKVFGYQYILNRRPSKQVSFLQIIFQWARTMRLGTTITSFGVITNFFGPLQDHIQSHSLPV